MRTYLPTEGRLGSCGRNRPLVCSGRDHLRVAALVDTAATRINVRSASSRLHANDGVLVAASVAATAQALYAFGSGLLTAVLIYLSGALYASYAGAAFFAWRRSASSRSRSPGLASPMGGADPSVQRKGNGCRSTLRRKANWDCAFCRAPSASSAVGRDPVRADWRRLQDRSRAPRVHHVGAARRRWRSEIDTQDV